MLRMYVNRQQPFGTIDWHATAAMLGISSTLRRRGPSEDCQKSSLSPYTVQRIWTGTTGPLNEPFPHLYTPAHDLQSRHGRGTRSRQGALCWMWERHSRSTPL